jgi:tRNA1Val (adenine37-N6)-methyltransferase
MGLFEAFGLKKPLTAPFGQRKAFKVPKGTSFFSFRPSQGIIAKAPGPLFLHRMPIAPDFFHTAPSKQGDDWAQPEHGYRFSRDSILLAGFLPETCEGSFADLGAGCGVVALEALAKGRLKGARELHFVEATGQFEPYLRSNAQRASELLSGSTGPPPKMSFHMKDWRELWPSSLGGCLDQAASNPPYFSPESSKVPEGPFAPARHELLGGLSGLVGAAFRLLKPGGIFSLSLPRERAGDLLEASGGKFLPSLWHFPKRSGSRLLLARLIKKA